VRSWQDRGMPYYGCRYDAQTHHNFWDGRMHYWTGMAVKGSEDQDPDNPNCCHDPAVYERGPVWPGGPGLASLRRALCERGHTHRAAGERLGLGLSSFRQRLYGRRPFSRGEFGHLCRLAGVDPETLLDGGGEDDGTEESR